MNNEQITTRQLWIWIAAAMSAPLAHFSGSGWLAALLAALVFLPLTLLSREGWHVMGRKAVWAEFLFLPILAGVLLKNSSTYWPSTGNEWVVPLTLLALAAASDSGAGQKVGPVIGLILAVLAVPVLVGALGQVEFHWLEPKLGSWPVELAVALLIPALAGIWKAAPKGQWKATAGFVLLASALSALTQGLLSCQVASAIHAPLYQVARTVRLGETTCLESVVNVAVTLGWYTMGSFLLSTAAVLGQRAGLTAKKAMWISAGIAAVFAVLNVEGSGFVLLVGAVMMWVILPVLAAKKKSRKI